MSHQVKSKFTTVWSKRKVPSLAICARVLWHSSTWCHASTFGCSGQSHPLTWYKSVCFANNLQEFLGYKFIINHFQCLLKGTWLAESFSDDGAFHCGNQITEESEAERLVLRSRISTTLCSQKSTQQVKQSNIQECRGWDRPSLLIAHALVYREEVAHTKIQCRFFADVARFKNHKRWPWHRFTLTFAGFLNTKGLNLNGNRTRQLGTHHMHIVYLFSLVQREVVQCLV